MVPTALHLSFQLSLQQAVVAVADLALMVLLAVRVVVPHTTLVLVVQEPLAKVTQEVQETTHPPTKDTEVEVVAVLVLLEQLLVEMALVRP
jgi:hypothetical protein